MVSSSLAETKWHTFSIISTQAARPAFASAGLGAARMPMISPASLVLALAAPA